MRFTLARAVCCVLGHRHPESWVWRSGRLVHVKSRCSRCWEPVRKEARL